MLLVALALIGFLVATIASALQPGVGPDGGYGHGYGESEIPRERRGENEKQSQN